MKILIPSKHYEFYRQAYNYLHHTLNVEAERYPNWEFAKTLIANYLKKHQEKKQDTYLLENGSPSPQNTEKNPSTQPHKNTYSTNTVSTPQNIDELDQLHKKIYQCQDCFLGAIRKRCVKLPSPPSNTIPLMVIVDIPSFYDQTQGLYFKDEAGALLKKILLSIGVEIDKIYYTATIKCSYSQEIINRLGDALPCQKYLQEEIRILQPKLILAFGKTTYDFLMLKEVEIHNQEFVDSTKFSSHSGHILSFCATDIMFTYHPNDLLINSSLKKTTWEHLKKISSRIAELKKKNHV